MIDIARASFNNKLRGAGRPRNNPLKCPSNNRAPNGLETIGVECTNPGTNGYIDNNIASHLVGHHICPDLHDTHGNPIIVQSKQSMSATSTRWVCIWKIACHVKAESAMSRRFGTRSSGRRKRQESLSGSDGTGGVHVAHSEYDNGMYQI